MPLTSSMEDYLEAVLVLQQQKGYVRCVDVAELLDVKKPSVSRAVKELSKKKMPDKKGRWHTLPHRAGPANRPANL